MVSGGFRLIGRDAVAIVAGDHDEPEPLDITVTQTWSLEGGAPAPPLKPAAVVLDEGGATWVGSAAPAARFDGDPGTSDPCTGGATAMCDENCPDLSNPGQQDTDMDGIDDACDPT